MSYIFQVSEEVYIKLVIYAQQRNQTPEALFDAWINEILRSVELLEQRERVNQENWQGMSEEELRAKHPIFSIAGILSIDEPGWADRHDEYIAEECMDNHADE